MASETGDHVAIHATAVAIGGRGLLIRGPSKAGKSSLALALIEDAQPPRPVVLVGDDRILLSWRGTTLIAAPHPRIAGLIEKRGTGILACPYLAHVPVAGLVDLALGPLGEDDIACRCDLLGKTFPSLRIGDTRRWSGRSARVSAWFAATSTAH